MAFVIDPSTRTVRVLGIDDPELETLRNSDPCYLNDDGDVIYEGSESQHYFVIEGIRRPLNGVSVIVGTSEEGDDSEPQVSLAWIQDHLDFGTASNGMYFGDTIVRSLQ